MKNKIAIGIVAAASVFVCVVIICLYFFTPNKVQKSLDNYYNIDNKEDCVLIFDDEIIEERGRFVDGEMYIPFSVAQSRINTRLHLDSKEKYLNFTTPTEIIRAKWNSKQYSVNKTTKTFDYIIARKIEDEVYVSLNYVKQFSNMTFKNYDNPKRTHILTYNGTAYQEAKVEEATRLRMSSSIKSYWLVDLKENDSVRYVEGGQEDNGFIKVITTDGVRGFVKASCLSEPSKVDNKNEDYKAPQYSHVTKEGKVCMAWHQVSNMATNDYLLTMLNGTKGLTVIAPTWFSLMDNAGSLNSFASQTYITRAHEAGVEVWATVDDFNYSSKINMKKVLQKTSNREKIINTLISAAVQYNFDGINIDFEKVKAESGQDFIQFIRELSVKCRGLGIVLSIDNYVPASYNAYYQRAEQGIVADYVITMAYDEHGSWSEESGSNSSLSYVKGAVENMNKLIDPSRHIVALPFYTRVFTEEQTKSGTSISTKEYGMQNALTVLSSYGIASKWDDETGQYYGEKTIGSKTIKIWLEDEESLAKKMEAVFATKNTAGVAFWKLGLEKMDVWDTIIKYTK